MKKNNEINEKNKVLRKIKKKVKVIEENVQLSDEEKMNALMSLHDEFIKSCEKRNKSNGKGLSEEACVILAAIVFAANICVSTNINGLGEFEMYDWSRNIAIVLSNVLVAAGLAITEAGLLGFLKEGILAILDRFKISQVDIREVKHYLFDKIAEYDIKVNNWPKDLETREYLELKELQKKENGESLVKEYLKKRELQKNALSKD